MKKRIISMLLAVLFLISITVPAAAANDKTVTIILDDKILQPTPEPFITNGCTMVPLRFIAEAMGLTVSWASDSKNLSTIQIVDPISSKNIEIVMAAGKVMWIEASGQGSIELDVEPVIVNGSTYVPIRFFAEAFDYIVDWNPNTNTVTLTNPLKFPLLDGKTADTPYSLINNRLQINMPKGAVDTAVNYGGVMGYSSDTDYESTLILSEFAQSITVQAYELYQYSTGNLQTDANLFFSINSESAKYSISTPIKAEGIEYVKITPNMPKEYDDTGNCMLTSALVCTSDGTLIFVEVAADRKAMTYEKQCNEMAEQIIHSLKGGSRLLDAKERKVNFENYEMTLGEGFVYRRNRGADFVVYYVYKLAPIGTESACFGMYFGNHPSYGSDQAPTQTEKDTVLDQTITWDMYESSYGIIDKDTYIETLVIIRINYDGEEWLSYIHIFVSPVSSSDWQSIRKMIRTLKAA